MCDKASSKWLSYCGADGLGLGVLDFGDVELLTEHLGDKV